MLSIWSCNGKLALSNLSMSAKNWSEGTNVSAGRVLWLLIVVAEVVVQVLLCFGLNVSVARLVTALTSACRNARRAGMVVWPGTLA